MLLWSSNPSAVQRRTEEEKRKDDTINHWRRAVSFTDAK
jgi:hypothetical protein